MLQFAELLMCLAFTGERCCLAVDRALHGPIGYVSKSGFNSARSDLCSLHRRNACHFVISLSRRKGPGVASAHVKISIPPSLQIMHGARSPTAAISDII